MVHTGQARSSHVKLNGSHLSSMSSWMVHTDTVKPGQVEWFTPTPVKPCQVEWFPPVKPSQVEWFSHTGCACPLAQTSICWLESWQKRLLCTPRNKETDIIRTKNISCAVLHSIVYVRPWSFWWGLPARIGIRNFDFRCWRCVDASGWSGWNITLPSSMRHSWCVCCCGWCITRFNHNQGTVFIKRKKS